MKIPRNFILITTLAGLTAGFVIRWTQRGGSLTGQPAASMRSPLSEGTSSQHASASHPRKAFNLLATTLEQRLSVSTGVTRWLEWMAALEKASLTDLPHLARMAKSDQVALRMIAAHWIERNPSHLFNTLIYTANENDPSIGGAFPRYELGEQLFEEWNRRDPAAFITALNHPEFPTALRDLRYTALDSIMKSDPETGLRKISEWHIENFEIQRAGVKKWAAANPRHAAEFALAHPAGRTTQGAMDLIGKAWAGIDPEGALSFSSDFKDQYGTALASGVLKEWATKDLTKAAAWLAGADPSVRGKLSGPMVEVWAKTDPAGAMDWVQQNMSGSIMDEALTFLLKGAADKDVVSAAGLVSGMDASPGRVRAAACVAQKWFPRSGYTTPPPREAVAWLSALDPASVKHVIAQIQGQWAGSDPKSLGDFLLTPAGQNASPFVFTSTAREMARKSPVEALDWADRLPGEHRTGATSNVFSVWQTSQANAAMDWLRKLPVTDARRESLFLVSIRNYFPGELEASAAAKVLASGDTSAAREAVQKLSMPAEDRQKLMEHLQLR